MPLHIEYLLISLVMIKWREGWQVSSCCKTKPKEPEVTVDALGRLVVFVRKISVSPNELDLRLLEINHENILRIQECFIYNSGTFCVYEYMQLTLGQVCSASVPLEDSVIAAICREASVPMFKSSGSYAYVK